MIAWALSFPWDAIRAAAATHGLDPLLVAAIVRQESNGQRAATRYERQWSRFVTPEQFARDLGISKDTEVIAQAHSYGLMQIMGATARGLGYVGYCAALIDVETGLEYGCKYLANQKVRFGSSQPALISSYNAGTPKYLDGVHFQNQNYVDSVLKYLDELRSDPKPLA